MIVDFCLENELIDIGTCILTDKFGHFMGCTGRSSQVHSVCTGCLKIDATH